jgi:hypothetical protein
MALYLPNALEIAWLGGRIAMILRSFCYKPQSAKNYIDTRSEKHANSIADSILSEPPSYEEATSLAEAGYGGFHEDLARTIIVTATETEMLTEALVLPTMDVNIGAADPPAQACYITAPYAGVKHYGETPTMAHFSDSQLKDIIKDVIIIALCAIIICLFYLSSRYEGGNEAGSKAGGEDGGGATTQTSRGEDEARDHERDGAGTSTSPGEDGALGTKAHIGNKNAKRRYCIDKKERGRQSGRWGSPDRQQETYQQGRGFLAVNHKRVLDERHCAQHHRST